MFVCVSSSLSFFPGSVFHLVFSLPVYVSDRWHVCNEPDLLHGEELHALSDRVSHIHTPVLSWTLFLSQTCISDENGLNAVI